MLGLFDKIDPSVIFVIVMVAIGAVQAIVEKLRRARAERELNDDLAQRAERRSDTLEPIEYDPPLDDAYDTSRQEILERQQRILESPTPPPEPAPPPLPAAAPPPAHRSETWAENEAPPPAPAPTPAAPRLSAEEQAALSSLPALNAYDQTEEKHRYRRREESPVRHLLSTRSSLRTAVILKEILGTPKGLE